MLRDLTYPGRKITLLGEPTHCRQQFRRFRMQAVKKQSDSYIRRHEFRTVESTVAGQLNQSRAKVLESAVRKLVVAAGRVGLTVDELIDLLNSGMSVGELLDCIESRMCQRVP
jgi:predicted butyrate kinase (DUF1464 family)